MPESPQILLPFAEREYIDVQRCCRILGVNETIVRRLAESGLIKLIDYRRRSRKKVHYLSVVDFCDSLRARYGIPDTRPPLVPPYRYRDEELLPFPLSDTIRSEEALNALSCSYYTLSHLIEEGQITAYRLVHENPWRISRSSVAAYRSRVLEGVSSGPRAYRKIAADRNSVQGSNDTEKSL